eukprot:12884536-Prorocentrum_lima.AAC.1
MGMPDDQSAEARDRFATRLAHRNDLEVEFEPEMGTAGQLDSDVYSEVSLKRRIPLVLEVQVAMSQLPLTS